MRLFRENPRPLVLPAHPPEEVHLQGLEVEEGDEVVEGVQPKKTLAAS